MAGGRHITPGKRESIRNTYIRERSIVATAEVENVAFNTVRLNTHDLRKSHPPVDKRVDTRDTTPQGGNSFQENPDGTAVLSLHTEKPVKTLEDAMRVAEVDTLVWYVDRWECSQWTVPMNVKRGQTTRKLKTTGGDDEQLGWEPTTPIITQQYRVKVFLRRIVPRAMGDAINAIYERMAKYAPRYPKIKKAKATGEPCLAVFGLFDAHFGKLCWAPETGSNYDLKIAEQVFRNATNDLIAESKHRRADHILLPIGNDFFHMDNRKNTTYRGTPQDVDGRYAKVFEAGLAATVWAVEQLASVAPVDVVWVPGNHDPTISYHLAKTVEAWFRTTGRVKVDAGAKVRKYFSWGSNLIGLTHGDAPKPEDLPGLMASECRDKWASATTCEWLLGHQHRSRQWVTKGTDTHKGTTVRVLRALTGTDAWHYENGYVGSEPAAEVYWYGHDRGYIGHAVVPARERAG